MNTGKFCERFRYKGQYKPLSQRMLEEPFWLGLIAIGSVIILISFAYCLKKMFAEKIEQFFTEEIEKAKYMRTLLNHLFHFDTFLPAPTIISLTTIIWYYPNNGFSVSSFRVQL